MMRQGEGGGSKKSNLQETSFMDNPLFFLLLYLDHVKCAKIRKKSKLITSLMDCPYVPKQ